MKDPITITLTRDEVSHLLDALDKQIDFFEEFEGAADEEIEKSNSISSKLWSALNHSYPYRED